MGCVLGGDDRGAGGEAVNSAWRSTMTQSDRYGVFFSTFMHEYKYAQEHARARQLISLTKLSSSWLAEKSGLSDRACYQETKSHWSKVWISNELILTRRQDDSFHNAEIYHKVSKELKNMNVCVCYCLTPGPTNPQTLLSTDKQKIKTDLLHTEVSMTHWCL